MVFVKAKGQLASEINKACQVIIILLVACKIDHGYSSLLQFSKIICYTEISPLPHPPTITLTDN